MHPRFRRVLFSALLATLAAGRAYANLTLEAGTGPATLALNDYGVSTSQTFAKYESAYGGSAGSGFVFQTGQTTSAVGLLIVYNPDGSTALYYDPKVPAYEGADDSIFAVLNRSQSLITQVRLNAPGSGLAGFDGDGADATAGKGVGYTNIVGPGPSHTGYEGPTSSFLVNPLNLSFLTVNFITPIDPGTSAFLFVENVPLPIVNGITHGGSIGVGSTAVPEPSSFALLGLMAAGTLVASLTRRAHARRNGLTPGHAGAGAR
jgi:hypothetical protein